MANNKWNFHPLLPVLLFLVVLAACFESEIEYGPIGPAGPAGPIGPAGPAGDDATASQEFTGSGRCGQCHEAQYDSFILSGHPQSLTKIENGQPPVFPYDAITGGVLEPPSGLPWEDISYAIGGFKWKALFIDRPILAPKVVL